MKNKHFLRKNIGKIICLLISVFLVSCFCSFDGALAESTGVSTAEELLNYFNNGGEVKLLNDITLEANAFVRNDVTLDLNGYSLNMSENTLIPYDASLIVEDNSDGGTGNVTGTASFVIQIGSSTVGGGLILNSGTIDCQGAYCVRNLGSLDINGGTISGKDFVVYNQGNHLVMNGGTVVASEGDVVANYAEGTTFVMEGGLVKTLADAVAVRLAKPDTTFIMNGGTVEALYGDTETGSGGNAVAAYKDTEVIINGGDLVAFGNTISGNGSASGASEGTNAKFTVNGGTVTSLEGAAIYAPQINGETVINGGSLTGKTGIEIRAGSLVVTGGTIVGNGEYEVRPATNGLTTWGTAISVAQHTTAQPITVTLTGGYYDAEVAISNVNPLDHDQSIVDQISVSVEGGEYSSDDVDEVVNDIPRGYTSVDTSSGGSIKITVVQTNPAGYYLSTKTSGAIDIIGSNNIASTDYSEINVLSNCRAGYDMVMNTSVDDNTFYLDGSDTSAYQLSPIQDNAALITMPNTWGYFMSDDPSYVPTAADPFHNVPTLSGTPAVLKTFDSTASDEDIDDKFRLYFGANIGERLAAGEYKMVNDDTGKTGGIVYQMTANPSCTTMPVEVSYNQNLDGEGSELDDGTNVDNFPTYMENIIRTLSPDLTTITLSDKVPTRDNYLFVEWNTQPDGSGNAYQPDDVIIVGNNPGELIGEVTLYAIWTDGCAGGTICYDGNGADAGVMANQTGERGVSVALTSPNFSRTGYGFVGWNTKADGTGKEYGAQGNFVIPTSGGTILYAEWVESTGSLQDWTGADEMEIGDVTALTDERDGQTYAVAKLADGRVWTIENSRLDPSGVNFSVLNTNHPTADFIDGAKRSSSSNTLCKKDNAACVDTISYNTNNLDRTLVQSPTDNNVSSAWYSYGVLYNWHTATAGNGKYDDTSESGEQMDGNVAGDICPAGWHLPTGNNGEYVALNTAVSIDKNIDLRLRAIPNNFVRSGEFYDAAPAGRGEYGRIWSSTASEKNKAYRFGFTESSVTPNNTWNKWDALAVRCVYDGDRIPTSRVTIDLGEHVASVKLMNETYGEQVITTDGESVKLVNNTPYVISATFEDGYTIDAWSTTPNGQLGDSSMINTTYTVTDSATLSIAAKEATLTTFTLNYDTGASEDVILPDSATSYNTMYDFEITHSVPVIFGQSFIGWSETEGSTTVDYVGGDTITLVNSDPSTVSSVTKTLYAVYQNDSCPAGNICYFGNGAESGTMSNQIASSNVGVALIPSNYARPGYGFAGWITDPNATPYGPNATITTPDLSISGLKLYAKWVESAGSLQGWGGCSTLGQGVVTALTDERDGNTYAVAKLADDKCWVIENLRLDPSKVTFTNQNTNSPDSGFIDKAPKSASLKTLCTTTGTACEDQLQYNLNNLNRSITQSYDGTGNSVAWYSYGAYYNWYTVTAGNGLHSTVGDVGGDICPVGWHLPTGGSGGEYNNLNTVIGGGSTNDGVWRSYPNNFLLSGEYKGSSRSNGYAQARIWTSTAKDANNAFRMGLEKNKVTPSSNAYNKWEGFAARCVNGSY